MQTTRASLVVLLVLLASCDASGGVCSTSADCGDGFVCSFALSGRPTCSSQGRCVELSRCFGQSVYFPTTAVDPDSLGFGMCGCDGRAVQGSWLCPSVPIVAFGLATCTCTGAPVDDLHAGPRGTDEPCQVSGSLQPGGFSPARCCDCSLAVPRSNVCGMASGERLPDGCCNCFRAASPDPTGRCVPPGGVYPAGAPWCCPIDAVDAGAAADAG